MAGPAVDQSGRRDRARHGVEPKPALQWVACLFPFFWLGVRLTSTSRQFLVGPVRKTQRARNGQTCLKHKVNIEPQTDLLPDLRWVAFFCFSLLVLGVFPLEQLFGLALVGA